MLKLAALGPEDRLILARHPADDGRHALTGADEVPDPRLAGVARPLAKRLTPDASEEPVHQGRRDHVPPRRAETRPNPRLVR